MSSRKKRRLSKHDLRAAGVKPGLMARRYDADGRARLEQLTAEASEAKLAEAQRERNLAHGAWGHARGLIQSRADRIRAINHELRELQEGGR